MDFAELLVQIYEEQAIQEDLDTVFARETERVRHAKHRSTIARDKAKRTMQKKAKPYVCHTSVYKKEAKKIMHKANRKGYMPHTRYYKIGDSRYYDGLYHGSIYSIAV